MRTNNGSTLQKITRWLCFVASILTFVVGLIHIFKKEASLRWSNKHFIDDSVNKYRWRGLFSFAPNVFVENWTAVFFGIIGVVTHFSWKNATKHVSESFKHAFIFMIVMGLFATMAFAGGIGIIFSIVTYVAGALCLWCAFKDEGDAAVGIEVK